MEFAEFCKKVNYNNHVPTDLEIRTYMAKNSADCPHMDVQFLEGVAGSGTFTSKLTKEIISILNPGQRTILTILDRENRGFRIKKGQFRILPHPFYWAQPDAGCELFQVKHVASTDL